MSEGGLMIPRQIILLPWTECKTVALWSRLVASSQGQAFYTSWPESMIEMSYVCVDKEAMHSFMSSKLQKTWGLLTRKAGKPINMRFTKGKLHKLKKVALDFTLQSGKLEFGRFHTR